MIDDSKSDSLLANTPPSSSFLSCGIHKCALRCHRLDDHSKMKCMKIMENLCPKNHKYHWKCYNGAPKICPVCLEEAIESEKRKAKDLELEVKRQAIQREHAKKLLEIERNIEEQKQILKDIEDERKRCNVLDQKAKDLENLKAAAARAKQPPSGPRPRTTSDRTPKSASNMRDNQETKGDPSKGPSIPSSSVARDEWEQQKRMEGQSNEALDSLMDLIGLEEVKNSFLSIKAKVDTVVRQGVSLKDERLGVALLGNPGTGTYHACSTFYSWRARKANACKVQ